ncbi:MAG: hypothetical protein IIY70_05605 [Oscillospiraceae bacterium]|nr:hypothetical protein [Oscillospiraceae bacterium]
MCEYTSFHIYQTLFLSSFKKFLNRRNQREYIEKKYKMWYYIKKAFFGEGVLADYDRKTASDSKRSPARPRGKYAEYTHNLAAASCRRDSVVLLNQTVEIKGKEVCLLFSSPSRSLPDRGRHRAFAFPNRHSIP